MRTVLPSSILLAVTTTLITLAPPVRAQARSDKAASAQILFEEGMKLMKSGKTAAACPKFAESQRLDPGMGTQYRLAECYEQIGRLASAWALFVEVAEEAKTAKTYDREKIARQRAAALEPRLSKLTIVVPGEVTRIAGLEIKRDGELVGSALWGTAVPVDPGEHTVNVHAPGKRAWEAKGTAVETATKLEVQVPLLEDAPAPPPPPTADEVELVEVQRSKLPAIIAGGVAVAAVGVGVALIVAAEGKKSDVADLNAQIGKGNCVNNSPDARCQQMLDMAYQVDTLHNIGVGAFVGAGVLTAAAVGYLLWPQQKVLQRKTMGLTMQATPVVGVRQSGFMVSGSF